MTTQTADPYAAAMEAKPRQPIYWGSLLTDAHFVILEKGIGRLPYIEGQHPPERKVTAVELSLLPITEMNLQNPIERNVIAEFGEWTGFVLPSLQELGVSLQEVHGKFVKVKMIPTGRKYTNANGETRDASTFKFLKLFTSEEECIADYMSGEEEEPEPEPQADPQPAATSTEQPQSVSVDREKETAHKFLEVLVQQAAKGQTDLEVVEGTLATSLETTPLVSRHFNLDSEETKLLIVQEMGQNA
jgi:hypothetical protein